MEDVNGEREDDAGDGVQSMSGSGLPPSGRAPLILPESPSRRREAYSSSATSSSGREARNRKRWTRDMVPHPWARLLRMRSVRRLVR
jgi:hypothetical protein